MKHYGITEFTFWVSVIATGVLVAACGSVVPAAPAITATPASSKPHLALKPPAGTSNTRIFIEGTGFPERTRVRIGLSVPDMPGDMTYIGEVDADEDGHFTLVYIFPTNWPDGSDIDDPILTFRASTLDNQASAGADFQETSAFRDALTAQAALPATPIRLPVTTVLPVTRTGDTTSGSPDTITTQTITQTSVPNGDPNSSTTTGSIKTSVDFLNSLLRDPSGASSVPYLSQRLQTDIAEHWALPTGLGIQPGYNSFVVILLTKADDSELIQATLTYESGASIRDFTLIKEGDDWRIDRIVAGSR